jgi:hypothetical protein
MSTETEIRQQFSTGAPSTVSDATAQTFRDQLITRGIPADQIDATLRANGYGQHQQSGPKPSGSSDQPGPKQELIDTSNPRFSSDQLQAAAENLARFWTNDPQLLKDTLARSGITLPDGAPLNDGRTPLAQEYDSSNLAPVGAADYDLHDLWVGRSADADIPQLDRTIRGAMSELSVPAALGNAFANDMCDSAAMWTDLREEGDEASMQRYHAEQSALFGRVTKLGWEQAAEQMRPWLAKLSDNTKEYLKESGALESGPARIRLWQSYQLATARSRMGK